MFLLEPDVKEGQGGLRDIHTAMWIARIKSDVAGLDELSRKGLLTSRDAAALRDARDFLWRTRNELHFQAGRHQDRLTFESQEQVAQGLGFEREERLSEVETFMRSYYLHAGEVSRLTSLVIHRAVEHDPAQRRKSRPGRSLRPGVRIAGGTLALAPPNGGQTGPEDLLAPFVDLQEHRLRLGQDSREIVRARVEAAGGGLPDSAAANREFLGILRGNEWIYETLQEMHRTGVLDALIPEFGRVRCMAPARPVPHLHRGPALDAGGEGIRAPAVGGVRGVPAAAVTTRPGAGAARGRHSRHPVPRYRQGSGRGAIRNWAGTWRWRWRRAWASTRTSRNCWRFSCCITCC